MDNFERGLIGALFVGLTLFLVTLGVTVNTQRKDINNLNKQFQEMQTCLVSPEEGFAIIGQSVESQADMEDSVYQALDKINKALEKLEKVKK